MRTRIGRPRGYGRAIPAPGWWLTAILGTATPIAAADNALNAGVAGEPVRDRFEYGLSALHTGSRRSPWGLRYAVPEPPDGPSIEGDGVRYRASIEAGVLAPGDDAPAAGLIEYADWDSGLVVNHLHLSADHLASGTAWSLDAGGIARDDAYYHLHGDLPGVFTLNADFSRVPHVFATDAVSLYRGIGTESLTLPAGLTPGNNSTAAIRQALTNAVQHSIGLQRDRSRLALDLELSPGLELATDYRHESRDGTRPFGGGFFPEFYGPGTFGSQVETIEPIDYSTHDLSVELRYRGADFQSNLKYSGSLFQNHKQELVWDNPLTNFQSFVPQGRMALYPGNQAHRIGLDLAQRLPLGGNLNLTLAWSRQRQDEDLLPPTINSGIMPVNGIDLADWNTTAALSRTSADATVDNRIARLQLTLSPLSRLRLKAHYDYLEQQTRTAYTAFNPLSGQYGYISEDGAYNAFGLGVFGAGLTTGRYRFRSIPFSRREQRTGVQASLRLPWRNKLDLSFDHERVDRDNRERDTTWEDRLTLAWMDPVTDWLDLRLGYEFSTRRGTDYRYNPYEAYYTSSLPGYTGPAQAQTLAQLRKYDLSDRDQQVWRGRTNILLGGQMDLAVSVRAERNDYLADYGRTADYSDSANAEWSIQPDDRTRAYLSLGHLRQGGRMASINDVASAAADPNAGGTVYPLDAAWTERNDSRGWTLGAGFEFSRGRLTVKSDYAYIDTREDTRYGFASARAFNNDYPAADAGSRFPDLEFRRNLLQTSLKWRVDNQLAVRFLHRYERASTRDWHYDGLDALTGRSLLLAAVPDDYSTHLLGVLFEYRIGDTGK